MELVKVLTLQTLLCPIRINPDVEKIRLPPRWPEVGFPRRHPSTRAMQLHLQLHLAWYCRTFAS